MVLDCIHKSQTGTLRPHTWKAEGGPPYLRSGKPSGRFMAGMGSPGFLVTWPMGRLGLGLDMPDLLAFSTDAVSGRMPKSPALLCSTSACAGTTESASAWLLPGLLGVLLLVPLQLSGITCHECMPAGI